MKKVSVLIPTFNRKVCLAATLTALTAQDYTDFSIIIADLSDDFAGADPVIQTIVRLLELHGNPVSIYSNLPRRGIAQQRHFLLEKSETPYVLFIDDDVLLGKDAIGKMVTHLEAEQCGFVGMGLIGLSYKNDVRPFEQHIELWDGKVQPEKVRPGSQEWERYKIHNGANIMHVSDRLEDRSFRYKVAWIGGCILYDSQKLREVGGFKFWEDIPEQHCGEDVLVQLRIMERFGGCGILPSRAYHQEAPTTIETREFNAPECLR